MFNFVKKSLQKIYQAITSKLQDLFGAVQVDETVLHDLKKILLEADLGVQVVGLILEKLRLDAAAGNLVTGLQLKDQLQKLLLEQLDLPAIKMGQVVLLVGINGSGKTTLASKLANYYKLQNKKVLLVAADTFRAAAVEQLATWAQKLEIDMIHGAANQDPSSVVYQGCERFKHDQYDILIIDTAGRLQTKTNLMQELGKIRRVVSKVLPNGSITTLLTVDSMLGQNSLLQAQEFKQVAQLDGVVLTKMDGTGKGGVVFAISKQLTLPVVFISYGEQPDQIKLFNATEYVSDLINV